MLTHDIVHILDDAPFLSPEPGPFILALDDTLTAFSEIAPRQTNGVEEFRYSGGMSEEEILTHQANAATMSLQASFLELKNSAGGRRQSPLPMDG